MIESKYSHLKIMFLKEQYTYLLFDPLKFRMINIEEMDFVTLFRTNEEVSAILPSRKARELDHEIIIDVSNDWTCLRIIGDMPFGTVQGLLSKITHTLFNASSTGVCVISTFKSDFFFIRTGNKEKVKDALFREGWSVVIED